MCLSNISVSTQDSTKDLHQTLQNATCFCSIGQRSRVTDHNDCTLCLWTCGSSGNVSSKDHSSLPACQVWVLFSAENMYRGKEERRGVFCLRVLVQPNQRTYEKSMVTDAGNLYFILFSGFLSCTWETSTVWSLLSWIKWTVWVSL